MEAVKEKAQLERYPAYKDSGVEWLGEVPEHWKIQRIKYLFKEKTIRSEEGSEDLLSVSQYTGVTRKSDKINEGEMLTNAATLEGYKKVAKGDLVSNIMLAWNGSLGFSPFDGITSPAYSIYELLGNNETRFFHYLLRTNLYRSVFKRNSSGVIESRLRLYTDDFFRIFSLVPPKDEQTTIANFLDDKCGKIDTAIAQKERLIQLLEERKQILIQNAVTKGLNPEVKMKDSGVEWIGEIPEHWEVLPGLRFFKENKRKNNGLKEGTVLSLSYGSIKIKAPEKLTGLVPESFETYQIVEPGDIIIRCTDLQNDKTSLRTGLANHKGIITSAYINLNVIGNHEPGYLHYFLHFLDTTKVLYKFGSGLRQNLSFNDFKRLLIPSPPYKEQKNIVGFIQSETLKIKNAITLQHQQIQKLKEYKNSLIDSAVTGKILIYKSN